MENQLIDFMNLITKGFDKEYFYGHIKGSYKDDGAEVMFSKDEGWRARPLTRPYGQNGDWENFTNDSVVTFFNQKQLDLTEFETSLYQQVLTKAVYHNMALEKIVAVVGEGAFQEAEENMRDFGKKLGEMIDDTLKKTTKLELV